MGKERPESEAADVAPLPWSVPLLLLLVGAAVDVLLVLVDVGAAEVPVVGVEVVLPSASEGQSTVSRRACLCFTRPATHLLGEATH